MTTKAIKPAMAPPAQRDALTGLPGYEAYQRRLAELLRRPAKGRRPFSVGLFDLDGLGRLNAEHGREAGDGAICALAGHLKGLLAGDAGEAFRCGGDAIAVILPGMTKEEAFLRLEAARSAFGAGGGGVAGETGAALPCPVGVSCAVAAVPDDGDEPQGLQRKLLAAIYRAKVAGAGKACLAREEKMVTKTSHYAQGQLEGLARLAKRLAQGEAVLLREALDDLLRKYNA